MFSRRVHAHVRSTLPTCSTVTVRSRTFAAAAAVQGQIRPPALADITPDGAASFAEKQKKFREGLVAAQKQKEQEESASPNLDPIPHHDICNWST